MNKWIIGTAVAALVAIPALAQMSGEMHEGHGMGMKAPQTRAEVEARVKEHFAKADANGDGVITKAEADSFHDRMRAEMADRMFAKIDTDKDGKISRAEFDAHHQGGHDGEGKGMHHRGEGMKGGMDMFAKADANGDGKVTLAEANTAALAMFDKADANKDGTVTPEERRAAMKGWMDHHKMDGDADDANQH